jgi:DNA-binding transcriptional MerR regulator
MENSGDASRGNGKSNAAFRTISEVAVELEVPQHVLRFWETKFGAIRPLKRAGGRRYYRPEDVVLLKKIRELLYRDGYTIKGVQKLLRETGGKIDEAPSSPPSAAVEANLTRQGSLPLAEPTSTRHILKELRDELETLRAMLG